MTVTHTSLTSLFSDIADAIRAKTGSAASIVADDFPSAIAAISGGNFGYQTETANGNQSISFDNLAAEPIAFAVQIVRNISEADFPASTYLVIGCQWPVGVDNKVSCNLVDADAGNVYVTIQNTNAGAVTYNNGTLTIDTSDVSGVWFNNRVYRLLYLY